MADVPPFLGISYDFESESSSDSDDAPGATNGGKKSVSLMGSTYDEGDSSDGDNGNDAAYVLMNTTGVPCSPVVLVFVLFDAMELSPQRSDHGGLRASPGHQIQIGHYSNSRPRLARAARDDDSHAHTQVTNSTPFAVTC